MDRNAKRLSSLTPNSYPSDDENMFSFPVSKSSQVRNTSSMNQHKDKKFVIPDFSGLYDLQQSRTSTTNTPLSATSTTMPEASNLNQQPHRIRQAAPRKDRKTPAFNLNVPIPLKFEETTAIIPSRHTHTSTFSDEFSPNESSSPVRITQRSRGSGNEEFVLRDHENVGFGDQTLVSVEGKQVAKTYGDSGSNNPVNRLFNIDPYSRSLASHPHPTTPPRAFVPDHHHPSNETHYTHNNDTLSRSRSRSLMDSTNANSSQVKEGGSTDALMQLMSKWRVTEEEHAAQRVEIERLRSELNAANNKNMQLSKRIDTLKAAATKGLETSQKSLSDLDASFQLLKAQAQQTASEVDRVRLTAEEIANFKAEVDEKLELLQPLFDENGIFRDGSEAKVLVKEMHDAYLKSQEVIELLREKLSTSGGELIEARNRVTELEANQVNDGLSLKASTGQLLECGEKISNLAALLSSQKQESIDGLVHVADMQAKLVAANKRIGDLVKDLNEKDAQLRTARIFHQKNVTLQSQLDDKNSKIASLETVRQELSASTKTMSGQETQIRVLEASNDDMTNRLANAEAKIQTLQDNASEVKFSEEAAWAKNAQAVEKIHQLARERDEARNVGNELRDKVEKEETTRYLVLNERFEAQSVTLKQSNEELQKRLDAGKSLACELAVLEKEKSVLKERFEAQSLTLKQSKQSNEELQKRLEASTKSLACEIAVLDKERSVLQERFDTQALVLAAAQSRLGEYKDMEGEVETLQNTLKAVKEANGELRERIETYVTEMGIIKEQKMVMQSRLNDQSESLRAFNHSTAELRDRFEASTRKLSCEVAVLQSQKTSSDVWIQKAEIELADGKKIATSLSDGFAAVYEELKELKALQKEPQENLTSAVNEEVTALKKQLLDAEEANAKLVRRAKTIHSRHKAGDLSDEEKAFMSCIIQMSKEIHEEELVNKANELRQRDNLIKVLQTRIGGLETSLARHLQAEECFIILRIIIPAKSFCQAESSAAKGIQMDSMVDLHSWVVSSPLTSPPDGARDLEANNIPSSKSPIEDAAAILDPMCLAPSHFIQPPARTGAYNNGKNAVVDTATRVAPLQEHNRYGATLARLNRQDSNDIADFEDHSRMHISTELGKRDRTDSPNKEDISQEPVRPIRRPRASTHAKPDVHPEASKSKKPRKRR